MTKAAVALIAPIDVAGALGRLGRTEDVRFSPSGRRIAIAGFGLNVVWVLDVEVASTDAGLSVTVSGVTEVACSCLHEPHGLCFLGEDTVAIANRHAEVPIIRLPPAVPGLRRIQVEPLQVLRADDVHGLKSPGSVVALCLAPDLYEILVCNNYADNVSRHVVDARDGYRVLSSAVLVHRALEVPDGAAISHDRRWLAVSNHNTHQVMLYRYTAWLGPDTGPEGLLENVNYPHGLCFTADDAHLVVADAGAPYVYAFARGGDDWQGTRQPIATNRIMDEETYLSGRYNTQEGGPKGLDFDPTMRVVVISSEFQPLRFFAAGALVPGIGAIARRSEEDEAGSEATRAALIRALRLSADALALESTLADRDSRVADLEALDTEQTEQIAELERTIAERVAIAAILETRVAELQQLCAAELDEARVAADYHRRVAADRDTQLEALRSSTSWRVTGIARWCIARGRRRP